MKKELDPIHNPRPIHPALPAERDVLEIEAIDAIEFYCENARLFWYFLVTALGFEAVAYRGPETKYPRAASYVLTQGGVRFVITSPITLNNPVHHSVSLHGITVKDIALRVPNCETFYAETVRRGAVSDMPPMMWEDASGRIRRASIKTYGDTIHSLVDRSEYTGLYWPGFAPLRDVFPEFVSATPVGILSVDHCVGNVELGKMNHWVQYYEKALGFTEMLHFTDKAISTEYSALMSKVMRGGHGNVKFPINEPAEGKRKSQIQEYLDYHFGPGVQHVALETKNLIETVTELRKRGVMFIRTPKAYYAELPNRVGTLKEEFEKLAELGILADRDHEGYLLQIFTKPIHDRPTMFFEFIQREGSQGFGEGNFKALFEAIEREQAQRQNL